jgi:putative flippase GtrA
MRGQTLRQVLGFVVVGGINTVGGYGIYLLLFLFLSYRLAYSIAYLIGIGVSYLLNTYFVFGQKPSASKAIQYPLVYVVQYIFGIIALTLLVEVMRVNPTYAPLAVIVLTIPITFTLTRFILTR